MTARVGRVFCTRIFWAAPGKQEDYNLQFTLPLYLHFWVQYGILATIRYPGRTAESRSGLEP